MLEYPKEEMKKAILDLYELPEETDLLKTFPILKSIQGFDYNFKDFKAPDQVRNSTIRYINYVYSAGLTIIKGRYPDYLKRKVECARLAGFHYDQHTGKFNPKIEEILSCKNKQTNQMIIGFLRYNYSDKYATMQITRDRYYRSLAADYDQPMEDFGEEKKRIVLLQEIEKMEHEYLQGDKTTELTVALIQNIEAEALGLKPEDIASRLREGRSPIDFDPYL